MKRMIENIEREKDAIMRAIAKLEYEGNYFPQNGDYVREDGIVICGLCGGERGYWAKLFEEPYDTKELVVVPIKCKCQLEREAAEAEQVERAAKQSEQEDKRQRFLKSEAYRNMRVGNSNYKLGNVAELGKGMKYAQKLLTGAINKGLILSGGCGVGKTHIAACIANELIDNGKSAYIDTVSGMLQNVFKKETETELMQIIDSVDLLVIDDFGAQRDTTYAAEKVFEIIDRRIRSSKPLIITTNLTATELKNPLDRDKQRLYSRMLGACGVLSFNNSDIRLEHEMAQTQAEFQELFS